MIFPGKVFTATAVEATGWRVQPQITTDQVHRTEIQFPTTYPEFVQDVLEQMGSVGTEELEALHEQERIAVREVRQCEAEIHKLSITSHGAANCPDQTKRLAEVDNSMRSAAERLSAVRDEIRDADTGPADQEDVRHALQEFDPVWNALSPREQTRVLNLLVKRVDYNGESGQVEITFEPDGFDVFLEQFSERQAVA